MQHQEIRQQFDQSLIRAQKRLEQLNPEAGFALMIEFYKQIRVDDCNADDGDMLLYQWGPADWGQGERFLLDLTRQVMIDLDGEDEILQLSLQFLFQPSPETERLGAGNRWCMGPDDLIVFEESMQSSPAYRTLAQRADASVTLVYDCAG